MEHMLASVDKVAFFGLGRMGLPIAAVLSQHHEVRGYDPDPNIEERLTYGHRWERNLSDYLGKIKHCRTPQAALDGADVAVVAVQTPHATTLDGTHSDTGEREPFDTSYLEACLKQIGHSVPVIVMSTVLPGTCRRLAPLVSELVYSPVFIAMGTTIRDFLHPEFVLVGLDDPEQQRRTALPVQRLYLPFANTTYHVTSYETAELTKMAYNTLIGLKLAAANTVGWLAETTGADGAEVMRILSEATDRIVSPAYMQPGLGDGGACHPRDQIALSWLAQQNGVYDLFTDIIHQREAHTRWIIDIAYHEADKHDLPAMILGSAYKPETTLTDGSVPRLMQNLARLPVSEAAPVEPRVIIVGVAHSKYRTVRFPEGSVVVDPWGIVKDQPGVKVVRPGRTQHASDSGHG